MLTGPPPKFNGTRDIVRLARGVGNFVCCSQVRSLFAHSVRIRRSRRCCHSVPNGLSGPSELRHGRPRLERRYDMFEVEPFVARTITLAGRERSGHHRPQLPDRCLCLRVGDAVRAAGERVRPDHVDIERWCRSFEGGDTWVDEYC